VEAYHNKVSAQGDVFGLGTLLYYMMEGHDRLKDVPESSIAASIRVGTPLLSHWMHDAKDSACTVKATCASGVSAQV
jgi:hypothetical protein